MYRLGLTPVTGKRGTVTRMRDQLHRLFSTTIRWTYTDEGRGRASGLGLVIAGEHQLWWSPQDPAQQPSWRSRVVLGTEFFEEITKSSVPVDLRALRLLKRPPFALDIYCWLTSFMSTPRHASLIRRQASCSCRRQLTSLARPVGLTDSPEENRRRALLDPVLQTRADRDHHENHDQ
jgi:hypothetical protein